MLTRRSFALVAALSAAAFSGCIGGSTGLSTSPAPGFTVEASVLSASLAEDCPSATAPRLSGACAQTRDAGAGDSACGGYCQQSNLQLSLVASAGPGTAAVEVVSVRLLDATSGAALGTLASREPQQWSGSMYVAWDQVIEGGDNLRVSYKLSAPAWATLTSGTGFAAYSRRFVLEVSLRIGGGVRVIRSGEITREPQIVT